MFSQPGPRRPAVVPGSAPTLGLMHAISVVFDEVLHVHRNRASKSAPEHTVFSFMSNFKYTPYITVPGSPRLEPGMKVRALLREPEDWKTLVGWLDLTTGELAGPDAKWHLHRLLFLAGWFTLASALMGRSVLHLRIPEVLLWLLFASIWAIFSRIEYKAWRRAQVEFRALQSLAGENQA